MPPRGKLDFVLFEISPEAIVAMPHPMPESWRDAQGVEASDGSAIATRSRPDSTESGRQR